jgi:LDH2 family malate/lactate/ureidoglycolate dehydrogenase
MGHLVMARAAETAIELARASGIGWVGARRSNHAGAAGVYAALPLPHGMVGIYGVVASANHMPVWGGVESLLGTNPVAIAIPAGEEAPIVLDIATSVVSYGTVKSHRLRKKPMPEGWMVNTKDGERLPIRHAAARACCCRSAATKAAALRSSWAARRPAQWRRLRARRVRLQLQ